MQIPDKLEKRGFAQAAEWKDAAERASSKSSVIAAVLRNPLGAIGISLLICFCILAFLAPGDRLVEGMGRVSALATENQPPCASHWLGCDAAGRDLATRVRHGARMSVELGLAVALIDIVVGALFGAWAAWSGRRFNAFLMRCTDFFYALPLLLVMILVRNTWKPGWVSLLVAMSLFGWIPMARMVRQGILTQGDKTKGAFRRFWAVMQGPVLITLSLMIPEAICIEGCLSFLGLGMEPPYYSLGVLSNQGLHDIRYYPWHFFAPAVALIWLVLSMHLVAESVQDVFSEEKK